MAVQSHSVWALGKAPTTNGVALGVRGAYRGTDSDIAARTAETIKTADTGTIDSVIWTVIETYH